MPTFLALHHVKPHMSPDEAATLVYETIKRVTKETRWLRYWLSDDTGKMICLWSARDAQSVWDLVRAAGVPTSDVFQVEEGDPALLMTGLDK